MSPSDTDLLLIARSIRRSQLRTRGTIALAQHRRLHPQHLAELLDADTRDVRRAIHGELPYYAVHLGLERLGIAALREDDQGPYYEVTPLGLQVAPLVQKMRGRRGV